MPPLPPLPPGNPGPDDPDPGRRGARSLGRIRGGTRLLGVRVSAIVLLELVAAALLLFRNLPAAAGAAVVVVAVALAVAAIVPFRGMRLGTWLLGGVLYAARRHVVTAEPVDPRGPEDTERITVPPDLAALFPGLSVRQITSRAGDEVGLVQWQGRWLALLAVATADADVLATSDVSRIPVDRMVRALAGQGFELDAVQIVTQSLHGNLDRFGGGALATIAAEHQQTGAHERSRDTWIAVRIDPVSSATPIAVRGGGIVGLGRLATAAISRIEAEAKPAGLTVRPLDARGAVRTMADSLVQPPVAQTAPTRWIESRLSVVSGPVHHRCFAVKSWRERSLDTVPLTSGYALTVAHEIRRAGAGVSVLSVVRVSATSRSQLDQASGQLRTHCRAQGIGLRLLRGQQAGAFRMTVPAGRR